MPSTAVLHSIDVVLDRTDQHVLTDALTGDETPNLLMCG